MVRACSKQTRQRSRSASFFYDAAAGTVSFGFLNAPGGPTKLVSGLPTSPINTLGIQLRADADSPVRSNLSITLSNLLFNGV